MKKISIITLMALISFGSLGQEKKDLIKIFVNENVSTHFIYSEPISYVDISNKKVVGDLPLSNILRIKPIPDDSLKSGFIGVLTIVGEKTIAQFELEYVTEDRAVKNYQIGNEDIIGFINPEVSLSTNEMRAFCLNILKSKPSNPIAKLKRRKVEARLNGLFTVGDYFFVDLSFHNKSNIRYVIDQIRFRIEDKKIVKSTNYQQIEVTPVFRLYSTPQFKKNYRNIFVFKKFTFPDEKVFSIEMSEEQISGRTMKLKVSYTDVLKADTF